MYRDGIRSRRVAPFKKKKKNLFPNIFRNIPCLPMLQGVAEYIMIGERTYHVMSVEITFQSLFKIAVHIQYDVASWSRTSIFMMANDSDLEAVLYIEEFYVNSIGLYIIS